MESTSRICNTLHHAIEQRNLDEMMALFADDARLRVVDRDHTPSHPLELSGKDAIAGYLGDVFGRDMSHRVFDEIVGDGKIAFSEECRYPDGTQVFATAIVEVSGGKIVRETEVQAWDEQRH